MIIPHLVPLLTDPDTRAAIIALIVLLSLPGFCFLFGAGPRVLRINPQRHQYSLTQGVPFLTWTKRGFTRNGELSVSRSKSGTYALLFRAQRWRFGLPLETFQTENAARSQAWQIADKLNLSVQRRDLN